MLAMNIFDEMFYAYRDVSMDKQHTNWEFSPDQYWKTNFYKGYTKAKDENVTPPIATQKPLALALELILRFTYPGICVLM